MDEGKSSLDEEMEAVISRALDGSKEYIRMQLNALLDNSESNISLEGYNIDDDAAVLISKLLKKNTACVDLVLEDNSIGDVGCRALGESMKFNSTLNLLRLGRNSIGDDGCQSFADGLKQNNTLTALTLFHNSIGDAGCRYLADGLKHNNTLQTLVLFNNSIGDAGCRALADSFKHNNTLNHLTLNDNKIGTSAILYLANVVKVTERYMKTLDIERQDHGDGKKLKNIFLGSWDLKSSSLLGRGNFGAAHLGKYKGEHDCVIKSAHDIKSVEALYETMILFCLPEHKNVVKLIGKCDDFKETSDDESPQNVLVLQVYNGGSLQRFVQKHPVGKMSTPQQIGYARQMCAAIQHLHLHNMVHRDVALRNFVLTEDFKTVVLIDFGLSFIVEQDDAPFLARPNDSLPFRLLPPESMFGSRPFYKASDIWMLGISFWEMYQILGGRAFFPKTAQQLRDYILQEMVNKKKKIPLHIPKVMPQEMRELLWFCCEFDFKKRLTATQLLERIDDTLEKLVEGKLDGDQETVGDHEEEEGASEYVNVDDYSGGGEDTVDYGEYIDLSAYCQKYNTGEDEAQVDYYKLGGDDIPTDEDFMELMEEYTDAC